MKAQIKYTLWSPDLAPQEKTKTVHFEGDMWTGFEKARAEFHRQVKPTEGERIDIIHVTLIDEGA